MTANRFRFKVWDKGQAEFIGTEFYIGARVGRGYKDLNIGGPGMSKLMIMDESKYVLMQSTGLCDKNGKEIFEGDVIGFDEGDVQGKQTSLELWEIKIGDWECTCGDYYCNESGVGVYAVGYNGYNRESGCVDKYHHTTGIKGVSNKCEIIGNIYENPELLEDESL